jgi:hypothetical protein
MRQVARRKTHAARRTPHAADKFATIVVYYFTF